MKKYEWERKKLRKVNLYKPSIEQSINQFTNYIFEPGLSCELWSWRDVSAFPLHWTSVEPGAKMTRRENIFSGQKDDYVMVILKERMSTWFHSYRDETIFEKWAFVCDFVLTFSPWRMSTMSLSSGVTSCVKTPSVRKTRFTECLGERNSSTDVVVVVGGGGGGIFW